MVENPIVYNEEDNTRGTQKHNREFTMENQFAFQPYKFRRVCKAEKRGKIRYGRCIGFTNMPDGTRRFSVVFGNRPNSSAEHFRKVDFLHHSIKGVHVAQRYEKPHRTPQIGVEELEAIL